MNRAEYRSAGRNLLILATSTGVAQALTIAASPILTRLYTPEDFGLIAVFFAIPAILRPLATLQYDVAIPVSEDDGLAMALVALSCAILLSFSALTAIVTWAFGEAIAQVVNVPRFTNYIWMLPLVLVLQGMTHISTAWAIRNKTFSRIGKFEINTAVSSVSIQLLCGLLNWSSFGMILGRIIGRIAGNFALLGPLLRAAFVMPRSFALSRILGVARLEWRFPVFNGPSELLRVLSVEISTILLANFFGTEILGLYMLMNRVLQLPSMFVTDHIRKIFLSSAVEAKRAGSLPEMVEFTIEILLRASVPLLVICAFSAPDMFALIFGATWRDAGIFAAIMSPLILVEFVASPISQIPIIHCRQGAELKFRAILLSTRIGSIVLGGLFLDPYGTMTLFAGTGIACWLSFMLWVMSIIGCRARHVAIWVLREMVYAVPFTAPLLVVAEMPAFGKQSEYVMAVAAVLSGALVLAVSLLRLRQFISQHALRPDVE